MQGSSASDNAPQPPQVYRSKGEILACLRPAQQQHIPLRITFNRQGQQFQSFVVEIDEAKGLIALDEFIPREAERLLEQGQSFRVDSFHEGIKVTWQIDRPVEFSELDGTRCYWIGLPAELTYHQRRNAYRVKLLLTQPATAELSQGSSQIQLRGQLIDLSATGCKLRFPGNVTHLLQPGQQVQSFTAELPIGAINTPVTIRHVACTERMEFSDVGVCFNSLTGAAQRQIERFIYQLQRENRRFE
ncbi:MULTISPECIES: flagellar brake protein [Pseudomonas]|uniref:Pilus assembly protein PilZ n=1 Tax=Pseudomonas oryzihabitans TaxID=47885 RepID=A0A178LEG7_9PSED|nr:MULTISPECIES: flagellar brake protein [Pseudomonas]NRH43250.1 pilus assembly protein PilZ [Pseudomonas sp. MS15a(2019)]MDC7828459.1 flagellar brake protein [Pseudomonas benzopyrenica]OAN28358.1 pilus assembly protein PilZ [Pseudomonas oryzihabitans]UUW72180.1 flagellar brake protein [Pseudomonas psychrotolerans]SEP28108.1 c-di-GMP-binding flagellar brake protein YcgR, contains PilZNR and PilZ domains [Pseudomonas sp. Snoq117.2]